MKPNMLDPSVTEPTMSAKPASNTPQKSEPSQFAVSGGRPGLFWLALLLGTVWLLFLAGLARWTANPVTLNEVQLRQSEAVVVATIVGAQQADVRIEQVIAPQMTPPLWEAGDLLTVKLAGSHWKNGDERILPLVRQAGQGWTITPAQLTNNPSLDYPRSPDLVDQIKDLLAQQPRR